MKPLTDPQKTVFIANVTFEPGCRNNWHIHHATEGRRTDYCSALNGRAAGIRKRASRPQSLKPGSVIVVTIPAEVKHWHGAKKDSWFSHLAVEVPGEETSKTNGCEPVTDEAYDVLEG